MQVDWTNVDWVSQDIQNLVDRLGVSCHVYRDRDATQDERLKNLYDMQAFASELSELCTEMSRFHRRAG